MKLYFISQVRTIDAFFQEKRFIDSLGEGEKRNVKYVKEMYAVLLCYSCDEKRDTRRERANGYKWIK